MAEANGKQEGKEQLLATLLSVAQVGRIVRFDRNTGRGCLTFSGDERIRVGFRLSDLPSGCRQCAEAVEGLYLLYTFERRNTELVVQKAWTDVTHMSPERQGLIRHLLQRLWLGVEDALPDWLARYSICALGKSAAEDLAAGRIRQGQIRRDERRRREESVRLRNVELEAARERRAEALRLQAEQDRAERQRRQQEELERRRQAWLEQEGQRRSAIRQLVERLGITRLVHFTPLRNLASIVHEGLLSRQVLQQRPEPERPVFPDDYRMDRCPDAICLSIGFPNYKFFFKARQHIGGEWAVLDLSPDVLWELDCAFCQQNAAASAEASLPLAQRRGKDALARMFGAFKGLPRDRLQLPEGNPTHPQAEVLVMEPVPVSYIRAVYIEKHPFETWSPGNPDVPLILDTQFFGPRSDYRHWQPPTDDDPYAQDLFRFLKDNFQRFCRFICGSQETTNG